MINTAADGTLLRRPAPAKPGTALWACQGSCCYPPPSFDSLVVGDGRRSAPPPAPQRRTRPSGGSPRVRIPLLDPRWSPLALLVRAADTPP